MTDRDSIVSAAVSGLTIRENALRHECSVRAVRAALAEYAAEMAQPGFRATALAIEVQRIETLEAFFARLAIANSDAQAGTLACKLAQRKSALLGLDTPVRLDMQVAVEPYRESSTQRLHRVLNELKAEETTIEGTAEAPAEPD